MYVFILLYLLIGKLVVAKMIIDETSMPINAIDQNIGCEWFGNDIVKTSLFEFTAVTF